MASSVAIHEAQQHLSELCDRAEKGEEIVIQREGHTSMRLVPIPTETQPRKRVFGQNLLGITYIAPDFDAPMTDEELAEWGY